MNFRSTTRFAAVFLLVFALVGTAAHFSKADIRSNDPKDPYSLRYSQVGEERTVLELCGPDGCRALGPVTMDLSPDEIEALRKKEKFFYRAREVAGPLLLISFPAMGAVRGVLTIKLVLTAGEKRLPQIMAKLYEKFGKDVTIKWVKRSGVTYSIGRHALEGYMLYDKVMNPASDKAALEALSPDAIAGKDVHVDFSVEQLARVLEADLYARQMEEEMMPPLGPL
jgi:hypothetical protein